MSGGVQRRCMQVLIYAVAIVLLAGVSVAEAAERTGPSLPGQEQATPAETTAIDSAGAEVPADDPAYGPVAEFSEESLSVSATEAYVAPYQHEHHAAMAWSEYCRSSRIYRSEILGRLWVRGEYIAWSPKGVDLPSLLTSAPVANPANTTVLFGNNEFFQQMSSGGRLSGGFWWTPEQLGGIEASYFDLDGNDQEITAEGDGATILTRPYFNVQGGPPNVAIVAAPGVLDGAINIRADMELSGAECLLRRVAVRRPGFQLDMMAGYRYGGLLDRLATTEAMVSLNPSSGWATGTVIERLDSFKTATDFHGGEVGLLARWNRNRWALDVTGKVALGGNTITSSIAGSTRTWTDANSTTVLDSHSGGLLALPSNIGRYSESEFAVMSELEVALRYELTCDLWFRLGYNFLGWNRVSRLADQLDVSVNPSQMLSGALIGASRPAFTSASTSFWAQGLNVGLEYQF